MDSNKYNSSMECFAQVDNGLAASQTDIGESSNLAQICLTYTYNFDNKIYEDNVCILAVLAQVAIDSAKRKFDINVHDEICRIKKEMNVAEIGYPSFWMSIRKGFNEDKINYELKCPMNEVCNVYSPKAKTTASTLPMRYFFKSYKNTNAKTAKSIEEFIQKYSIDLMSYNSSEDECEQDDYLLLKESFNEMIYDIKGLNMGMKYVNIFSWLINRAFMITPNIQSNKGKIKSTIHKNKSLLLKTLYEVDKNALRACFLGATEEPTIF